HDHPHTRLVVLQGLRFFFGGRFFRVLEIQNDRLVLFQVAQLGLVAEQIPFALQFLEFLGGVLAGLALVVVDNGRVGPANDHIVGGRELDVFVRLPVLHPVPRSVGFGVSDTQDDMTLFAARIDQRAGDLLKLRQIFLGLRFVFVFVLVLRGQYRNQDSKRGDE